MKSATKTSIQVPQGAFVRRYRADLLCLRRNLSAVMSDLEQMEYELLNQDETGEEGTIVDVLQHHRAMFLELDEDLERVTVQDSWPLTHPGR